MMDEGQREFAQPEKPIGMPGPFHGDIVTEIKWNGDAPAFQFIDDRAVVDAMNGHHSALARIEEAVRLFAQVTDIRGLHTALLPRDLEIVARLLMGGIELEKDDVFRILVSHNG